MGETLQDRPKEQRIGGMMALVGMVLCFTLLGAPLGLVLVLWGTRKWKRGERQHEAETETETDE
jgi:hypothetical protein